MFLTSHAVPSLGFQTVLTISLLISGSVAPTAQVVLPKSYPQSGQPKTLSPLENEILAASSAWTDALLRGDLEALDRLQTDDFLTIQETKNGVAVIAREKEKESARPPAAGQPKAERTLANVKFRQYGEVVVLTALATFRSQKASDRISVSQAVITEIWVKQDGAWRISHFQPANVPAKAAKK